MKSFLFVAVAIIVAVSAEEEPELFLSCVRPVCGGEEIDRKWPVADEPQNYYECIPTEGGYEALMRPCADDLWFDFRKQECVPEGDWRDVCTNSSEEGGCGCTTDDTSEETDEECEACTCTETEEEETTTDEEGGGTCGCSDDEESSEETTEESSSSEEGGCGTDPPIPPPPKNPECGGPKCDCEENARYLWPGKTPRTYYRCVPCGENAWAAQLNQCEDSIMSHFSYSKQACVRANEWKNECRKGGGFSAYFPQADDLLVPL